MDTKLKELAQRIVQAQPDGQWVKAGMRIYDEQSGSRFRVYHVTADIIQVVREQDGQKATMHRKSGTAFPDSEFIQNRLRRAFDSGPDLSDEITVNGLLGEGGVWFNGDTGQWACVIDCEGEGLTRTDSIVEAHLAGMLKAGTND